MQVSPASILADLDLKPAPVVRKRKKQMVLESCKDDRYWERRRKNNMAAKRSRDARRAKENQVPYCKIRPKKKEKSSKIWSRRLAAFYF